MDLKTLQEMKKQMMVLGNWKEVRRINRMMAIRVRELEKRNLLSFNNKKI